MKHYVEQDCWEAIATGLYPFWINTPVPLDAKTLSENNITRKPLVGCAVPGLRHETPRHTISHSVAEAPKLEAQVCIHKRGRGNVFRQKLSSHQASRFLAAVLPHA